MVWNAFRSGLMELSPREISRANPVLSGTVIATMMNVFFSACTKNGSLSTYRKLPSPTPVKL